MGIRKEEDVSEEIMEIWLKNIENYSWFVYDIKEIIEIRSRV